MGILKGILGIVRGNFGNILNFWEFLTSAPPPAATPWNSREFGSGTAKEPGGEVPGIFGVGAPGGSGGSRFLWKNQEFKKKKGKNWEILRKFGVKMEKLGKSLRKFWEKLGKIFGKWWKLKEIKGNFWGKLGKFWFLGIWGKLGKWGISRKFGKKLANNLGNSRKIWGIMGKNYKIVEKQEIQGKLGNFKKILGTKGNFEGKKIEKKLGDSGQN